MEGIYLTAEHALLQIIDGFETGILPDVIFVDIELGEGMNGPEFCRIVTEKCRNFGKYIEIRFVTSSNMTIYAEEIQKLMNDGVITHASAKSEFYVPHVIDELARLLSNGVRD